MTFRGDTRTLDPHMHTPSRFARAPREVCVATRLHSASVTSDVALLVQESVAALREA
jgi:hypothetical protein